MYVLCVILIDVDFLIFISNIMKIAIIQYSTYGHVTVLSEALKKSIDATGLATAVDILQVPETLPETVLTALHAAPKPDFPIATPETLIEYDAFLFGFPTRYGTLPAQFLDFWSATSGIWSKGQLAGKPAGLFVSTGSQGGGQEITLRNTLSILVHHGMIYIPLGYAPAFKDLTSVDEIHGGSPYGAGAFAAPDGSRQPSELELRIVAAQGADFAKSASKFYTAPALKSKSEDSVTEKTVAKNVPKRTQAPNKEVEGKTSCAKCVIV